MLSKLSRLEGDEWVPHLYGDSFVEEEVGGGRLVVYPAGSGVAVVRALLEELASPVFMLWVLHTSRLETKLGRYQSPKLSVTDALLVLNETGDFFDHDARSDVWFVSPELPATIVLEQHGLIYAYGPVAAFRRVLEARGMREGPGRIPSPHAHDYHAEYDAAEAALVKRFDWTVSPLRPEDEG